MSLYNWLLAYIGPILGVLLVLLLAALAGVVWLYRRLQKLEKGYQLLTAGADGGNLEAVLHSHMAELRGAVACVEETDARARRLEQAGRSHIQQVGFLRFNPFRETGGDQSFALALADLEGNGVVLSSLHSRDVTRVYGKALAGWESAYPLTAEEQQVIDKAKNNGHARL